MRRITESLVENWVFGVGLDFKMQSWGEAHGDGSGLCASLSSAVMMPGLQNLPHSGEEGSSSSQACASEKTRGEPAGHRGGIRGD